MVAAIVLLVISVGSVAVGWGYVKTARRMRSFQMTSGTIIARELAVVRGDVREGHWGSGGGYRPKVTYTYAVDDSSYTSDRLSYAHRGLKKHIAEQKLAAIPDEVDVYYDPAAPQKAYLEKHSPRIGYVFIVGGSVGTLVASIGLLAS